MTEHRDERPTPDEAARALRDVQRRRDQSLDSVRENWWVRILMGIVIFVLIAAPDFLGPDARSWTTLAAAVVVLGYSLMQRSRRGAAVLGRPARMRKDEMSTRYVTTARLVLLAVVVIGFVIAFLPPAHLPTIPYLHTIVGAVVAIALIIFGPAAERSMRSFARRGPAEGALGDGSR